MVVAWLAFPFTLAAICAGLGLLLDALSGRRLPGSLIAPAGFAALLLGAQLASLAGASIALISTAAIVLAGVGVAAAMPWRFGAPDPWAIAAAVAAFALFAAPVLLSGDPTFATYGTEAEIASWLTFAADDPVGAVLPFAVAQQLIGGEAAWHFQPYLATLAALLSLCAWQITRVPGIHPTGVGEMPGTRAFRAFLAAIPALIFGYAGWGGVQELAALVPLALVAALMFDLRPRAPLAIALAAALAALVPFSPLSLDSGAWLATVALAALTAATLALSLWVASTQPRAAFVALAAALAACAVLASANVSLAPYGELNELRQIDGRFAGRGPALPFGQNPYAGYFLRDVDLVDSGEFPLSSARGLRRTEADQVDYRALLSYSLLVIPRSPEQSRPPLPYRRVWLGEDYEVWKLPSTATFRLLFHMSIGGPLNAIGLPDCSQTVGLGLLALANQLGAAPQDITLIAAAPRRADRLGRVVGVPVDRAQDLCGRRWDWIEAISPGS